MAGSVAFQTKTVYRDIVHHFPNGSVSVYHQSIEFQRSTVIMNQPAQPAVTNMMLLATAPSVEENALQWSPWMPVNGNGSFAEYRAPFIAGYKAVPPLVSARAVDPNTTAGRILEKIDISYQPATSSHSGGSLSTAGGTKSAAGSTSGSVGSMSASVDQSSQTGMTSQNGQTNITSQSTKRPASAVKQELLPQTGQSHSNESIGGLMILAGLMLLGFKKKSQD